MKTRRMIICAVVALFLAGSAFAMNQDIQGSFGTDRVSQLMKKDVKDSNGKKIGSVSDIIFDQSGHASYVVIDHGGLLGIRNRLVPVPVSAFHKGNGDDLTLNIDKNRLEKAPSFASRSWPNFQDHSYDQKVNAYYGQ